jgi:hypothetical protein
MWLAAKKLGLGLVWRMRGAGLVRDTRLYEFIGSPENRKIIGNLYVGYSDDEELKKIKVPARTSFE